jgi:hypothetical protein
MRPCRYTLALGTFALGLWACGDSNAPDDDPLPNNAGTAVGVTVRDNVEASFDAFFPPRLLQPLSFGPAADPCATASAPGDTDGDGVPDDASYTFTAPPCRFEGVRGFNLDVVGTLRVVDPAAETAGFGAAVDLTNFRFSLTDAEDADRNYSFIRNGQLTLSGNTTGLELDSELQILRTFTGLSDAAVEIAWTMDFTPETTLQINQPLPSGSATVAGTVSWSRGDENFALTVTTVTPLHYDSACDQAGQRFDDGELSVSGTFGETPGAVRIDWSNCGEDPDISFVAEE